MSTSPKVSYKETADILSTTIQPDPFPSHTHTQPPASCLPLALPARQQSIPSSSSPVQSKLVEALIALHQEILITTKNPNVITPTQSQMNPAQKQRIEMKCQEKMQRRSKSLKRREMSTSVIQNHHALTSIVCPTVSCATLLWMDGITALALPSLSYFFLVDRLRRK